MKKNIYAFFISNHGHLWLVQYSTQMNLVCYVDFLGFLSCPSHPFQWPWVQSVFKWIHAFISHANSHSNTREEENGIAQTHQIARLWDLGQALQVAPCPPAGPEQSLSTLKLAAWKSLPASPGVWPLLQEGKLAKSYFFTTSQGPTLKEQGFSPLFTGVSPAPWHRAQMNLCAGNWRQDVNTPPLPFALVLPTLSPPKARPGPGKLEQALVLGPARSLPFSVLCLFLCRPEPLSLPLSAVIATHEDVRTVPSSS